MKSIDLTDPIDITIRLRSDQKKIKIRLMLISDAYPILNGKDSQEKLSAVEASLTP